MINKKKTPQKYHLVVSSLKKGWHDKDHVLLHAAFQLLVDFAEKEKPDKIIDWNYDRSHRQAWKEIKALYDWWKKQRPARKDPLDDKKFKVPPIEFEKASEKGSFRRVKPDKKKYRAYYRALRQSFALEGKWYQEDQRNLHRLIEIRHFLWT